VSWCGEGVTGLKKGLFNNHANDVSKFFKVKVPHLSFFNFMQGFHVQINARSEEDLNEQKILERLKKATGASYDSGAKYLHFIIIKYLFSLEFKELLNKYLQMLEKVKN
jgi:hypothetical protein